MENRTEADEIVTRMAGHGDVAAMLACDEYAQAHPERGDAVRAAVGKGHCQVAIGNGQVAGYVLTHDDFFGYGFVSLVVVAPGQQRRGVGLRLLAAAEAACQTEKLFTSTNQSNGAAQRLFASAGFVRSGQIDHLDEGDPELVYMKWCR
ncbi:acetyltransferase (GNAT) family protein [Janthinobacterium sp. 35]|uniref:GNAT family N-acetyltransferase n=1 Tax=unclassified Janthinobacterium TaxID=2610881 RepID=UPI000C1999BD|nr:MULTISPECIES: GNAT family N-acetyltransferase [unclassified Janthinobacterium]PIG30922.1 acetyltransferase (GNAT) family protein [Janthinobacterium sp. 35]PVX36172.1 acetyltransferase (GNAT) family protein [Janthinobacterium sp. 78]